MEEKQRISELTHRIIGDDFNKLPHNLQNKITTLTELAFNQGKVFSKDKLPELTSVQIYSILHPTNGLEVFDTTIHEIKVYSSVDNCWKTKYLNK